MGLNKLSTIEKIAKVWQIQLNLEYCNKKKNVRISFKDIGSFCELLAIDYNAGFVGCGSGGMGLDLANYETGKAIEVKSCCHIQNVKCTANVKDEKTGEEMVCGTKFNTLFTDKCPKCNSTSYERIHDSRFGINATELLRQYKDENIFENFTMCYISLVTQNVHAKTITIRLEWFVIDFNDKKIKEIQLDYFKTQKEMGKKDTCNLLPKSYDFYKLCPRKIDEKTIEINYENLDINPLLKDCPFEKDLRVPIDIIPRKDREAFMALKSFNKKRQDANCKDFTKNMPYKEKSLGKERGGTRKTIYKAVDRVTRK